MNEFLKLERLQLACKVYESQLSVCKCTRYPLDLAKQFYKDSHLKTPKSSV